MSALSKGLNVSLSAAVSTAAGLLASALFDRLWEHIDKSDQPPPDPKDLKRSAGSALTAAALQGTVFGLVRAAVDRVGARGQQVISDELAAKAR